MFHSAILFMCIFTLTQSQAQVNYFENNDDAENDKYALDSQYEPEIYAKGYNGSNGQEIQQKYREIIKAQSDNVRRTIPYKSNIRYGEREEELLDIYDGNSLPEGAPIFVFIHGGKWAFGTKENSASCVKPLYEAGIIAVIVNFDQAPQVNMDVMVSEIREMADFVLALAEQYNSRGVWFGGQSTGAHLASQLMFDEYLTTVNEKRIKFFKGLVLLSGTYDLRPIVYTHKNDKLNLTREQIEAYSPLLQSMNFNIAKDKGLKLFIARVQYDPPAYRSKAEEFYELLVNNGVEADLLDYPDEDHFTESIKLYDSNFKLTKDIISFISSGFKYLSQK